MVGGDRLELDIQLDGGAHGLITTPGATRFYRSEGPEAVQDIRIGLQAGARLEWLPLETIAHPGCRAGSRLRATLAPGAELMGWDILALGLPAAGQPFDQGHFEQHLELPGRWLERARIEARDTRLRQSPLGWAGHEVLATMWLAAGEAFTAARRESLLDAARGGLAGDALERSAGVTAPQPGVLVLRALAPRVEPALQLLQRIRAIWRSAAWGLAAEPPRIWRT